MKLSPNDVQARNIRVLFQIVWFVLQDSVGDVVPSKPALVQSNGTKVENVFQCSMVGTQRTL